MRLWFEQAWLWVRYRNREARACQSIRQSMAALGFPIGDMTDEELAARVLAFQRAVASCGINAAEAGEALNRASAYLRRT